MNLNEHRASVTSMLELETRGMDPLTVKEMESLRAGLGEQLTEAWKNGTNIAVMSRGAMAGLLATKGMKDVLSVDVPGMGFQLHVLSYVNCKPIREALGWREEP